MESFEKGEKECVNDHMCGKDDNDGRMQVEDQVLQDIFMPGNVDIEPVFSREKFEVITHSTMEVIFIIDKVGNIIFINDRLEQVLGYKAEDLTGTLFSKFVPIHEMPKYLVQLRRVFIHKSAFNYSTRVFHQNGHLVEVEISGRLITYKGNAAALGTIRDITERKKVENALLDSLNSYKGLFDSVSEAIYIHKTDGVFMDVNYGATVMYGYSREELIGRTPEFVGAPGKNDMAEVNRITMMTMLTGKPSQFEFWGRRKNGEIFPKDVISHKGKYFGEDVIISTARDITEQKKAEQALRESEMKYRILAEKMHDVVWILNLDLQLIYVSPSTEYTLGYSPAERMSMRIDECMVPDSLDYAMQVLINEAVSTQEGKADKDRGVLLELEYYHKDGTTRWLEQSINGIYDEKGELTGIMGVARDVTERRKARVELQQSAESYRGLFNSVTDAIYVMDESGKFIDINEGAVNMYGYPHHILVGKDPSFVSAEGMNDLEAVQIMLHNAFKGAQQQFEFWGKRSSGECFLKDVRLFSGIYFGQKVIIATARDITNWKQSETDLKQKVDELEQMNQVITGEEQEVNDLRKEVNDLLTQLGREEKYTIL